MGEDSGSTGGAFCDECSERKRLENVDEGLPLLELLQDEEAATGSDCKLLHV